MSEPTAEQLIKDQELQKKRDAYRALHDIFADMNWRDANAELLVIGEAISGAVDKDIKERKLNSYTVDTTNDDEAAAKRAQSIVELLAELPVQEASAWISSMQNAFQVSINVQAKDKTVKELEVKLY